MRTAWIAIALGGCWTGPWPPAPANEAAAPVRVARVRPLRQHLVKEPPPRLTPEQQRFPPELRKVLDDATACVQRHGASIAHTLWLEVSIDAAGAVTAAAARGFGAAEPCVLHALRTRTFVSYTNTTISLTIPFSSGHPPP